jgi:hypothetical protein
MFVVIAHVASHSTVPPTSSCTVGPSDSDTSLITNQTGIRI